jgi:electron transfer flavoprotein alpha subunit
LDAGYVDGAIALPAIGNSFTVRKGAFSGKAYADVTLTSENKVISLIPNSYKLEENPVATAIEDFQPEANQGDFRAMVKEIVKASDKVALPEAEIVVSGGRGLKGPEHWGMVEELANLLGAATACSKPVSDAHWRPHSEHVGQTGPGPSSTWLALAHQRPSLSLTKTLRHPFSKLQITELLVMPLM